MRVEIVMPQMGESIVEGTIVEWLKNVGDPVEVDEDIFTLSTDKVDAEVPSTHAGVLVEQLAQVGDTIEVGKPVAIIETDAASASAAPPAPAAETPSEASAPATPAATPAPAAPAATPAPAASSAPATRPAGGAAMTDAPTPVEPIEELRRRRSTPLVRKMAEEHGISDLSLVPGTGVSGRVTKKDLLAFIEGGGAAKAAAAAKTHAPTATAPIDVQPGYQAALVKVPRVHVFENDRVEPMTRMRASIAENMLQARRGTAHCHTVWEADVTNAVKRRKELKGEYTSRGAKLTFTAFFVAAVVDGLRKFPLMNAAIDGSNIVYRGSVNVGVAAAIEDGLIVPVLKDADTLSLFGIAKGINDLAHRSKNKLLKPQDVSDGTFTISNAGIWGSLFGVPILVQPQVGILGIGGVKKRVMADENDHIRIRHMVNMCLTFDHRLIDGATADGFMAHVTKRLSDADFT